MQASHSVDVRRVAIICKMAEDMNFLINVMPVFDWSTFDMDYAIVTQYIVYWQIY